MISKLSTPTPEAPPRTCPLMYTPLSDFFTFKLPAQRKGGQHRATVVRVVFW